MEKFQNSATDVAIDNVVTIKDEVFSLLDALSAKLLHMENSFKKCNANFPFKLLVKEENVGRVLLEPRHEKYHQGTEKVFLIERYCLAWHPLEDGSKSYRLMLICEEQEICSSGFEEFYREVKLPPKVVSKKALLETDIGTRLEFSSYLCDFFSRFYLELACYKELLAGNYARLEDLFASDKYKVFLSEIEKSKTKASSKFFPK